MKSAENEITKVNENTIQIIFGTPVSVLPIELYAAIGSSRSGKVIEDQKTHKIIGVECRPIDFYDFLQGKKASREALDEFVRVVGELGLSVRPDYVHTDTD